MCDLYSRVNAMGLVAVKLAGVGGIDDATKQSFDAFLKDPQSHPLRVVICTADKMTHNSKLRKYFDIFHDRALLKLVVIDEADVVFSPSSSSDSRQKKENVVDALSAKLAPGASKPTHKLPALECKLARLGCPCHMFSMFPPCWW